MEEVKGTNHKTQLGLPSVRLTNPKEGRLRRYLWFFSISRWGLIRLQKTPISMSTRHQALDGSICVDSNNREAEAGRRGKAPLPMIRLCGNDLGIRSDRTALIPILPNDDPSGVSPPMRQPMNTMARGSRTLGTRRFLATAGRAVVQSLVAIWILSPWAVRANDDPSHPLESYPAAYAIKDAKIIAAQGKVTRRARSWFVEASSKRLGQARKPRYRLMPR